MCMRGGSDCAVHSRLNKRANILGQPEGISYIPEQRQLGDCIVQRKLPLGLLCQELEKVFQIVPVRLTGQGREVAWDKYHGVGKNLPCQGQQLGEGITKDRVNRLGDHINVRSGRIKHLLKVDVVDAAVEEHELDIVRFFIFANGAQLA